MTSRLGTASMSSRATTANNEISKKRSQSITDHYVTFTTTIALAFKRDPKDLPPLDHDSKAKKQKSFEAPKPRHFFHTEYSILNEANSKTDVDIITYGAACKLFREGETRLIRTFDDPADDKCWCVYRQHHQIRVTEAVLDKIYKNKVKIKIWDHKDRCTPRARFERPKAFRFHDNGTRNSTLTMSVSQAESSDGVFETNANSTRQTIIHSSPRGEPAPPVVANTHDFPYSIPKKNVNPAFFPDVASICASPVYEQRVAKSGNRKVIKSNTDFGWSMLILRRSIRGYWV